MPAMSRRVWSSALRWARSYAGLLRYPRPLMPLSIAAPPEATPSSAEILGRATAEDPARRGLARNLLVTARPKQWIKNGFVLLPAAFGGALKPHTIGLVVAVAAAFCLASSALYMVNDVCDREADRAHALKRTRPIASGGLSVQAALAAAVVLSLVSLIGAVLLAPGAALLLAIYMVTTLAYSLRLKHIVIVDVMVLATGFVLRVLAGAAAANVAPSEWLLLCTLFLALFLGFGKRRHELVQLGPIADTHRRVLGDYSKETLDQFLTASMIGTLFAYVLYVVLAPNAVAHRWLILTIPFACYSIFRYSFVVQTHGEGGAPEELLLTDRPLQLAAIAWVVTAVAALYAPFPHDLWH
jgi:4-hydroxybenzoate polyprenyltransferase